MRETKEKEIDGILFKVTQLPWRRQQDLAYYVTGKALPALGYAADGGAGVAFEKLFGAMSAKDIEKWQTEMMLFTMVTTQDGKTQTLTPKIADDLFQVRTGIAFTQFALEVNLGDFYADLAAKLQAGVAAATVPQSLSTSAKPGQAGDSFSNNS